MARNEETMVIVTGESDALRVATLRAEARADIRMASAAGVSDTSES
jgi:hypothetical protein